MARVGIVTDSSACLSESTSQIIDLDDPLFKVVPINISVDGAAVPDLPGRNQTVIDALRQMRTVSTSSPNPSVLLKAYSELQALGCDAIISVHLSQKLSATVAAARSASQLIDLPIRVVDSATTAFSMAFILARLKQWMSEVVDVEALVFNSSADVEGFLNRVERCVEQVSSQSHTFFVVDNLTYLHRGGRLGRTALALGSALKLKPLLMVRDGNVRQAGVVRTVPKSIPRIFAALDADAVRNGPLDIAIMHVDALAEARLLSVALREAFEREGLVARHVVVTELNAGIAAHTGPGTLAVAVMPAALPV